MIDRIKLLAAILITGMIVGVIGLMVWLSDITDGLIRFIFIFIGIVAIVYCNL